MSKDDEGDVVQSDEEDPSGGADLYEEMDYMNEEYAPDDIPASSKEPKNKKLPEEKNDDREGPPDDPAVREGDTSTGNAAAGSSSSRGVPQLYFPLHFVLDSPMSSNIQGPSYWGIQHTIGASQVRAATRQGSTWLPCDAWTARFGCAVCANSLA